MLKILQARLQQYVNWELPDVQAGFRKGRRARGQIAKIHWIMMKAGEFQKNIYFCFIGYTKVFDCVDHNCEIFLKRWEYESTLLASWETCIQDKKQWLEPDMEQLTDSKLGKEYNKAVYCHFAYLIYMQMDWMKHKLESRLLGEISLTSDTQQLNWLILTCMQW